MSTLHLEEGVSTWRLTGELTLATITTLLADLTQFSQFPQVVDLGEVTHTDSAGVALLIELRRRTREHPIIFRNIPSQMLSIANVCGVQELLTQ